MTDWTNIARPYAKAIFMHALDQKALPEWSEWLFNLQKVALEPRMLVFIGNPGTTVEMHVEAICDVVFALPGMKEKKPSPVFSALVHLLAENRRLPVLRAIFDQFEAFRAEEEQRIAVHVMSFSPLSDAQKQQLTERLTKRLKRKVELQLSIDPKLLGGAVISAKDWVINASLKGQLDKLGAALDAPSRG